MILYHDKEWGVSVHDDKKLFEYLILDCFQAGLSWSTILKKRINFRRAFDNFDAAKIARYRESEIKRLLADSGIVRNYSKIFGTIVNAKKYLEIQREFLSFNKYIWGFVGGKPIKHNFKEISQLPAKTQESDKLSEDLQ
ncbi:DNA-3-methyladenine glycosylase, partial [Candidatus Curtissbacteria bacterium RIFCSPHIGHO2_02_FULL_42_15]